MPVDARSLEIKPALDSRNDHEKIMEFKHRTSAGEKILHHIRLKRSQDNGPSCRNHADRKFMGFVRSFRAMGSKYQDLFKNILNLKCIYVSITLLVLSTFVLIFVRSTFNVSLITGMRQLK